MPASSPSVVVDGPTITKKLTQTHTGVATEATEFHSYAPAQFLFPFFIFSLLPWLHNDAERRVILGVDNDMQQSWLQVSVIALKRRIVWTDRAFTLA